MTVQHEAGTTDNADAGRTRYLRVKVVDHSKDGSPTVNVRIPISVAKFGMKMAAAFSPEMKGADLDWDAIARMIDEGAIGELVHVDDEAERKTVDVFVE